MLTDVAIKAEKPGSQPRKVADGGGLHLLINPNGNKLWRFSYRFGGKQKTMAMGVYSTTSLREARDKRDDAKKLLEKGIDPSVQRKEDKLLHGGQELQDNRRGTDPEVRDRGLYA